MAVLLVEASTGQHLLALGQDERRPVASITKLVSALVVVEALPAGSLVMVGEEIAGSTGSVLGLRVGEVWSVEDLLVGLMLRSGNDVAATLAVAAAGSEEAFSRSMTERLRDLGIEGTTFATASGLSDDDRLSAAELARVAAAILAEPRLRGIAGRARTEIAGGAITVENRNLLIGRVDGVTGLKTGFTSAAGYTIVATAEREGRELIAVVLGADTEDERFRIAQRALEHGYRETELRELSPRLELRSGRGPVLLTAGPTLVTVPPGAAVRVGWPVVIRPDDAPDGLELTVGDRTVATVPVTRVDARRPSPGGAGLGSALADGAYAAMRAVSLAGSLR